MSYLYPEDLQPLKKYEYIPETYKNKWEDYDLFLPRTMTQSFNKKIYYNFLQRECFNSCIQTASSSSISEEEKSCFNNCRNKHLSSLGIYEKVTLAKRKLNGVLDFVNLSEFNKSPEDIGYLIPTDPFLKSTIEIHTVIRRNALQNSAFSDLFNNPKFLGKPNMYEFYTMGYQSEFSNAYIRDNKPEFVPEKIQKVILGTEKEKTE